MRGPFSTPITPLPGSLFHADPHFSEQEVVVEVFAQLMRVYPHLRLQAVTGSYTALTEAMRRGEIDLVLGPLRESAAADWLQEEPVLDEHLTIIIRSGHPLAQENIGLEQLVEVPWVVGPHGTPTRRFFESVLLDRGMNPPAQICEMVTFPLAEKMVIESDAVGLLTYSARKKAALGERITVVRSEFPEAVRQIGIVTPRTRTPPLPHTLFREVLKACLSRGVT